MKKFFEGVMEWKTQAAFEFAGSTLLYTFVCLLRGVDAIAIPIIFSLVIVSSVGSFIQMLAFSERFIKKMRYTLRIALFAIAFFALLAANAYAFSWFPRDLESSWLIFSGVFLLIFAVMNVGWEIYFRVMGKKYDGILGAYRRSRGEAEG